MPIKEYIIKAQEALPGPLESLLAAAFEPSVIAKARGRGAKVKLIITTPWPKPPPKEKIVIDDTYVGKLKELAANEAALEVELRKLNGPQILQIGSTLGIPLSKNSKVPSLRAQLLKSLRSDIVWMGIAGQGASGPPTQSEI